MWRNVNKIDCGFNILDVQASDKAVYRVVIFWSSEHKQ